MLPPKVVLKLLNLVEHHKVQTTWPLAEGIRIAGFVVVKIQCPKIWCSVC